MFAKLTTAIGPVWVNPAHIVSFEAGHGGTHLRMSQGGGTMWVDEPPNVVAERFAEAAEGPPLIHLAEDPASRH